MTQVLRTKNLQPVSVPAIETLPKIESSYVARLGLAQKAARGEKLGNVWGSLKAVLLRARWVALATLETA